MAAHVPPSTCGLPQSQSLSLVSGPMLARTAPRAAPPELAAGAARAGEKEGWGFKGTR
jgi:hypothetical protein